MLQDGRTRAEAQVRRPAGRAAALTVFDARRAPYFVDLDAFGKDVVYFGRGPGNDIPFSSPLASGHPYHGRFRRQNGAWYIEDLDSTNGLICNDNYIRSRCLTDGDIIRIDNKDRGSARQEGVLIVVSSASDGGGWFRTPLGSETLIGRAPDCGLRLPQISVSKHHARIVRRGSDWVLEDTNSTNGVILNNRQLIVPTVLHEKDLIVIANNQLIYSADCVYHRGEVKGISLDMADVVITRGKGRKRAVTGDHVSLSVRPGELVALIGGSGAGKSTILNCMCGYLPPAAGAVYINGVDLYRNFETLKKTYGYVPQSDIVYNNLSVRDMLLYAAKLRLPQDTGPEEIETAIRRAVQTVGLEDRIDHMIGKLSGGQRKRASIAVELLSDPKLLFLDEPSSGLDPGTERSLMQSLRAMADSGKTVVLVTHSTLQLRLCDKIAFVGKGGRLCFYGPYDEALRFFGVRDIVDVYEPMTNSPELLRDRYDALYRTESTPREGEIPQQKRAPVRHQLRALCARYMKLVVNDRQRLILLLCQAPLLALLISFVADGDQFETYKMTKSLLFALSCSAFWIGILNAIQEVCKERTILKREYMTGVSLGAYLWSKILVMGLMCLVQSVMMVSVFALLVGLPEEGIVAGPFAELLLVSFLTALSAAAMGLFVSSLFTNADRAMTVAPLLLMPQILFSGLLFELEGATEAISWFAVCRWSMEGYGTTADLNSLPPFHPDEDFFLQTPEHFWRACLILLAFTAGFLLLSRLVLSRLKDEGA